MSHLDHTQFEILPTAEGARPLRTGGVEFVREPADREQDDEELARLSREDAQRVLNIIPQLYALRRPITFFDSCARIVKELIPSDYSGWFTYRRSKRSRTASSGRRTKEASVIDESTPADAYLRHMERTGYTGALRFHDMPESDRALHTREPACLTRSIRDQMTLPISAEAGQLVGLSFCRQAREFSIGDRAMANALQRHIVSALKNSQVLQDVVTIPLEAFVRNGECPLTPRESQVAFWISEGKTNGEIGMILGMTRRTAEKHVEHILAKLGLENRLGIAIACRHHKLGSHS